MEPAQPLLPLVVALVLGFAQAWDQLEYCQGKVCPVFTRTAAHGSYEERLYEASVWFCTDVSGTSPGDVIAAGNRLQGFIDQKQQETGANINENAWPGLILQEQRPGGPRYEMCWMVRPEVQLTESNEGPVRVKTFPRGAVFVSSFGGTPSLEEGQANAEKLKADLKAAGESFDQNAFYGAAYERFLSFIHHNEIWIRKV